MKILVLLTTVFLSLGLGCDKDDDNEANDDHSSLSLMHQIYDKSWYISHEGLSGCFVLLADGSMSGSDGCNRCSYEPGSVYFMQDGSISWKVSGQGPLCTEIACPSSEDGSVVREPFFPSSLANGPKRFELEGENNLKLVLDETSYLYIHGESKVPCNP